MLCSPGAGSSESALFVDTHLEQMRRALNDLSQFTMTVKIQMVVLAVDKDNSLLQKLSQSAETICTLPVCGISADGDLLYILVMVRSALRKESCHAGVTNRI